MIEQSVNKLVTYKNERDQYPKDSDGIYIIIKGEAIVVNPYEV